MLVLPTVAAVLFASLSDGAHGLSRKLQPSSDGALIPLVCDSSLRAPIDITWLVDTSDSVGEENYKLLTSFLLNATETINEQTHLTRYNIVEFNSNQKALGDAQNMDDFLSDQRKENALRTEIHNKTGRVIIIVSDGQDKPSKVDAMNKVIGLLLGDTDGNPHKSVKNWSGKQDGNYPDEENPMVKLITFIPVSAATGSVKFSSLTSKYIDIKTQTLGGGNTTFEFDELGTVLELLLSIAVCPPTLAPTSAPSTSPTLTPTQSPTTATPTLSPTTATPSISPTMSPTLSPTTAAPSTSPTMSPTLSPTIAAPSSSPTPNPTVMPTKDEEAIFITAPHVGFNLDNFTGAVVTFALLALLASLAIVNDALILEVISLAQLISIGSMIDLPSASTSYLQFADSFFLANFIIPFNMESASNSTVVSSDDEGSRRRRILLHTLDEKGMHPLEAYAIRLGIPPEYLLFSVLCGLLVIMLVFLVVKLVIVVHFMEKRPQIKTVIKDAFVRFGYYGMFPLLACCLFAMHLAGTGVYWQVVISLFVLGALFAWAFICFKNYLSVPRETTHYRALVCNWRDKLEWFWVVQTSNNLVRAIFVGLVFRPSPIQAIAILSWACIYCCALGYLRPYRRMVNNYISFVVALMSVTCAGLVLVLATDPALNQSNQQKSIETAIKVLFMLCFIGIFLVTVVQFVQNNRAKRAAKRAAKKAALMDKETNLMLNDLKCTTTDEDCPTDNAPAITLDSDNGSFSSNDISGNQMGIESPMPSNLSDEMSWASGGSSPGEHAVGIDMGEPASSQTVNENERKMQII